MSDRPIERPADGPLRLHLDDGRLRLEGHDTTVDVPLAQIVHYTVNETPDPEVFTLRICLDAQVREVVMRHKGNTSVFEAIGRAWNAARKRIGPARRHAERPVPPADPWTSAGLDVPALEAGPATEETAPVEVPPPIGGPPLLADSPEWLIFAPMADTRLLARADLLVTDLPSAPAGLPVKLSDS